MRLLAYFFFYTYVGLLVVAGLWGAFVGAKIDQQMLFGFDIASVNPTTAASILTQYRFLRLIEFGFGMFALLFTKEVFSQLKFNRLFLGVMFLGVVARVISYFVDGPPNWLFYFFAGYELVGVLLIFLYTRNQLHPHGKYA
jgi:peptidoglycan/LPS O-acetylase OafA/YrhL